MKTLGIIFAFVLMTISINAQEKRAFMLGLNPSITVEQYYEAGELDINIFPAVVQLTINNRMDLRLITLFNVGIRNDISGFSQIGLETALPIFLKVKEDKSTHSSGFYAAPIISVSKSKLDNNTHFGLWAEPGYQFNINEKFSMVFGAQAGATYIHYIGGTGSWNSHIGLKVILGWWM